MGIFYNPPQPPTGSTAATPPLPHDPIPAQGTSPPPRRQIAAAVAMGVILASWPQDLEPRLQRPNDQQQKIAPLTLTYGQQPPRYSVWPRTAAALAAWPLDLEPRYDYTNAQQRHIVPLTLVYGDQPIPVGPLTPTELTEIVGQWPPDSGPLLAWPNWIRKISAVTASLPQVDQPPRLSPLARIPWPTVTQAWTVDWISPGRPPTAGWNVPPPGVAPYTPLPRLIWTAWEPLAPSPPALVQTAPLTLPTGDTPPPHVLDALRALSAITPTWIQTWDAQRAPFSASWQIPPSFVLVPRAVLPRLIWTAWDPDAPMLPTPIRIATLAPPGPPIVVVTGDNAPYSIDLPEIGATIILGSAGSGGMS